MVTASRTEWFSYKIVYLGSVSILYTKSEKKTSTFDKLIHAGYYQVLHWYLPQQILETKQWYGYYYSYCTDGETKGKYIL